MVGLLYITIFSLFLLCVEMLLFHKRIKKFEPNGIQFSLSSFLNLIGITNGEVKAVHVISVSLKEQLAGPLSTQYVLFKILSQANKVFHFGNAEYSERAYF